MHEVPEATSPAPKPWIIRRVDAAGRVEAAARLIGGPGPLDHAAGRRFVHAAQDHGIALDRLWALYAIHDGTVHDGPPRQACLATVGAGRTAMLFLGDDPLEDPAETRAHAERVALLEGVCAALAEEPDEAVSVAQTLPEPHQHGLLRAYADAHFVHVGELAYLRCDLTRAPASNLKDRASDPPSGVRVVRADDIPAETLEGDLLDALEASYIDTLDCPELCGLRNTRDVLTSHRAAGVYDPTLWRVVYEGTRALGVCMLSPSSDATEAELVYLGLGPALRGRGLASWLLGSGMVALRARGVRTLLCAVDLRNTPALALYRRLGFMETARRSAFVRPLRGASGATSPGSP